MKKAILIFLCLVLCFVIIACGPSENEKLDESSFGTESDSLSFYFKSTDDDYAVYHVSIKENALDQLDVICSADTSLFTNNTIDDILQLYWLEDLSPLTENSRELSKGGTTDDWRLSYDYDFANSNKKLLVVISHNDQKQYKICEREKGTEEIAGTDHTVYIWQ